MADLPHYDYKSEKDGDKGTAVKLTNQNAGEIAAWIKKTNNLK